MNGATLQTRIASILGGVGETITITRSGGSPSSFSVVAFFSEAKSADITALVPSAGITKPVLVMTLDGTQTLIKKDDAFTRDGRAFVINNPVVTRVGSSIICVVAGAD